MTDFDWRTCKQVKASGVWTIMDVNLEGVDDVDKTGTM